MAGVELFVEKVGGDELVGMDIGQGIHVPGVNDPRVQGWDKPRRVRGRGGIRLHLRLP
jgi:catabolite regulation protein CreA